MKTYCDRCLMNSSISDWVKTETGCNYCDDFVRLQEKEKSMAFDPEGFKKITNRIKKRQNKSKTNYDLVFGLSGGVDSCYALHKIVQIGLNPLVVHMDNGWNSELAQSNIENIIDKLDLNLETFVIDWSTYKKLQKALLDSDYIDIEILYDQAATAVCYKTARKYGIKYLSGGTNSRTEGFRMPSNWGATNKLDVRLIKDIYKKFGDGSDVSGFPFYSQMSYMYDNFILRKHWISVLDYCDYDKKVAINELMDLYDFKPYPYKHYESVFTRFYQGFLLPNKFLVDKRITHLSALVLVGEISRNDAALNILQDPYQTKESLERDKDYFLKKIGWDNLQLSRYLNRPEVKAGQFKQEFKLISQLYKFTLMVSRFLNSNLSFIDKLKWISKKFIFAIVVRLRI